MTTRGQERSESYIGRDAEKALLLEATDEIVNVLSCRAIYFEAAGGLGKTRLLEHYPTLIRDNYPKVCVAQIVDLYDPENRNPIEIERKLIDGLVADWREAGPAREQIKETFGDYYTALDSYRLSYESSQLSNENLGQRRLAEFAKCWNKLSDQYPLVMRFDTIELLFVGEAPEAALISTPDVGGGATMVTQWMRTVLPKLEHTLVLLSGRKAPNRELIDLLKEMGLIFSPSENQDVQNLLPFSDPVQIQAYLRELEVPADGDELRYIGAITEGRPLLLSCYAEMFHRGEAPQPDKPVKVRNRFEFESLLIDTIFNPLELFGKDPQALARALCFYFLAYARRGLYRRELRAVFELPEVQRLLGLTPEDYKPVIDRLEQQTLIKRVYVPDLAPAPDGQKPESILLFIHDELFVMIDTSGKADQLGLRAPVLNYLCTSSREQVQR
jgi:hypothetical protein